MAVDTTTPISGVTINGTSVPLTVNVPSTEILTKVYPVGSIYMSTSNTSPASFLGGTWESIQGRFLFGAGANSANTTDHYGSMSASAINRSAGELGGETRHTLTVDEIPSHYHQNLYWNGSDISFNSGNQNGYYFNWGSKQMGDGRYLTTGTTGSGGTHNNMPPYLVVYMWKRTA